MLVLFPQKYNECELSSLDYGSAFFSDGYLYIKVNTNHLLEEEGRFYGIRIIDGVLWVFDDILVQYEPNAYVCLLETHKEKFDDR